MKLTMALLVLGDHDILAENLRFHHAMGIDRFIVMAERPSDAIRKTLAALSGEMEIDQLPPAGAGPEGWPENWPEDLKAFPGWVLSSPVETFWLPRRGDLRALLSGRPPQAGPLSVAHGRAVVTCTGGDPLGGVAHPRSSRAFERLAAAETVPGGIGLRHGATRGAALLQNGPEEGDTDLRLLHYPCRSLDQYAARHQLTATDAADHFRNQLARTREEIEIGLLSRALLREDRVAGFFADRDRQTRQGALRAALDSLTAETRARAREFEVHHANLISAAPREDRKNRPLYYNLRFAVSGPRAQLQWLETLDPGITPDDLCAGFGALRDSFSLFPQNTHFRSFLQALLPLTCAEDTARLRADCAGKRVILHTSCNPRLQTSRANIATFAPLEGDYHHIVLHGQDRCRHEDELPLGFSYDGCFLQVPVPDNYESLHRKLFYAYLLFDLLTEPALLVKIDDNILLEDAGRFAACLDNVEAKGAGYAGRRVGAELHETQWHGWHLGKCADPAVEMRGYQYPLPRDYAAGGHGYVLGRKGLVACSYMYLAMKAFFAMPAVGLEDACVGHAAYAKGVDLLDLSNGQNLLALPGLTTGERWRLIKAAPAP